MKWQHNIKSLSVHWRTQIPALTPEKFVKTLDHYRHRIRAIVSCRRFGTPDVYKELKASGIPIMSVRRNLVSKQKQRDHNLQMKVSALHLQHHPEVKSMRFVCKHSHNLTTLTKNANSKKNRASRKNKQRKQWSDKRFVLMSCWASFLLKLASEINYLLVGYFRIV